MGAQRSTLKELAAELDISVATASRALGGYEDISAKTRARVAQKAREIGYVPNSAGRMLVSGRSDFVGLVIPVRGPHLVDAFLGEFVTGMGEQLTEHGVDLFLATVSGDKSELDVLRHVVESGRADGVIINRIAEQDERIEFLKSRNFPFVAHGRLSVEDGSMSWLDTDGQAAFTKAFDMLYDLGHRRFGFLTIDEPMSFKHFREKGLEVAYNGKSDPSLSLVKASAERGNEVALREECRKLLTSENRPTAVLAVIDELAIILMQEAERLGITIPNDLSVIGFDNTPATALTPPGLSTFDQQIRDCARQMTDMLMTVIRDRSSKQLTKLIQPVFLGRGSHGPAPRKKL